MLCVTYSQSQTLFNIIYPKSAWDYSTAVIETNENSYLIASSSRSQFNSDFDILLMNIDTTGNIIWEKYLGQTNKLEFASSISKTNAGGYIIGGSYRAPGDNYNYDTYIVKIDSNGNEIWSQRVNPTSLFEDGFSAFENTSGEFVILGSGNHTHIYNLSNSGDLNWSTLLQNLSCKQIKQTSDGGYALIGNTTNLVNNEILLIKTNAAGDSIWSKQYEEEGNVFAYTFTLTPDEGFLIATAYDSSIIDDDLWTNLIRTDSNGDTLWTRKYFTGTPYYIQSTSDGGYVYSSIRYDDLPFNDLYSIIIAKINSNGEMEWYNTFTNKNLYGPGNNLLELSNGGYLLTGHTAEGGIADVFLIKLDADGNFVTGIKPLKGIDNTFKLYPNPAKDKVIITLSDVPYPDKVEIRIFDEFGKLTKSFRHLNSISSELDITDLKQGLYFVNLFDKNNKTVKATKKLVVIK
jgi:hypothetical protein